MQCRCRIETGFEFCKQSRAIRPEGLGFKGCYLLECCIRVMGHNISVARRGSCCRKAEGHIIFTGLAHNFIEHGAAQIPVLRCSPRIINDYEEWGFACRRGLTRLIEWTGNTEDDKAGDRQAQQHEPPGRLVRLFMLAHQLEQKPQGRKLDRLWLGRAEAQQPPDDGQQGKGRQGNGSSEGERLQEGHHAKPPKSKARLFAPPMRPCSIIRSFAGDWSVW